MAYFHCLIGGGSSGGGLTLTVTCDSDFAGTTITCTDEVTTLTATCPSASPYEVEFDIPNGGDWTISGVVSGQTITTGVNIPTTTTLEAIVQKTITIYSAKEDTITYTDIYGDTQTEVFASGQTSKQITIDINISGSSITFTSGVAKDPSNLSNYYSKTVTIDSNTTSVYLMPDNAAYWWGYKPNEWSAIAGGSPSKTVTWNTNSVVITATNSSAFVYETTSRALDTSNTMFACFAGTRTTGTVQSTVMASTVTSDPFNNNVARIMENNTFSMKVGSISIASSASVYSTWGMSNNSNSSGNTTLYALWYE